MSFKKGLNEGVFAKELSGVLRWVLRLRVICRGRRDSELEVEEGTSVVRAFGERVGCF